MDKDKFLKKLGRKIAALRMQRGLSQDNVAAAGDVSRGTMDRIERGVTNVKIKTLMQIAEILDIPIKDLVDIGK